MAEVGASRVDQYRVFTDENVAPGLEVPIPQDLARAHASPRSPAQAAQLEQERQIQPQDHVDASAHEVAELALARIIDGPAVASADPRLYAPMQLLDGRFGPVRFVLD
jgi:hypothetical protein